jgi:hypothetical protein
MAQPDDVLTKGARVRLNSLGVARHPRDARKEGTIVGPPQYPNAVSVLWNNKRFPVTIYSGYLQAVEPRQSQAENVRSRG